MRLFKSKSDAEPRVLIYPCEGRYLLDVLRAFFNDREPPRPPDGLNEERFIRAVVKQQVVGIVADELEKRSEFFSSRFMDVLKKERARDVLRDLTFQNTTAQLDALFEKNGIRYLPLKGAVMKGLYPQSYQRSASDYDVLIDKSNFERAKSLLEENYGYREEGISAMHCCLINSKSNLRTVELHYEFWGRACKQVFEDPWSCAVPVENGLKYVFEPKEFYLCMTLHLVRHWLSYMETLRQFVDVWLFNRKFGGKFDRASLDEPLRNSGSLDFIRNAERAGRVWFEGIETDETVEAMAKRLFDSPEFDPLDAVSGIDPFLKRKSRLRAFIEAVLCVGNFKNEELRRSLCPSEGKLRPSEKSAFWLKTTLRRLKKKDVLRKVNSYLFHRDNYKERRAVERAFGFTEIPEHSG